MPRTKSDEDSFNRLYTALTLFICISITTVLLLTVSWLPPFGDPGNPAHNEVPRKYLEDGVSDTGTLNIVVAMILDYRAFDTFGEAVVLFVAVGAVMVLLRHTRPPDAYDSLLEEIDSPVLNVVLKSTSFLLISFILVYGCFVIINGHVGSGGGFPGGAILGSAFILYASAYGTQRASAFLTFRLYSRIVSISPLFYAFAKGYSFFVGANGIPSVIPKGIPGELLSAGLILPLNIAVGLIVAATVYVIFILFSKGEFR